MSAGPANANRSTRRLGEDHWRSVLARVWPWVSLAGGLISAVVMDRSARRAVFIALVGLAAWVALLAWVLLRRVVGQDRASRKMFLAGHALSLMIAQSANQTLLWFSWPFYVRASGTVWQQWLFVLVLTLTASTSLWDPWQRALLTHPFMGGLVQAVASFAGLNVVLPMLGVPNTQSLFWSAYVAAVAAPLSISLSLPRLPWPTGAALLALALGTAGFFEMPWARRAVPPVPLRLLHATLAPNAPAELRLPPEPGPYLICITEVWAPLGLRDTLVHLWYKDGKLVDAIDLEVRGGADSGFRTWSVKRNLGENPVGRWRCIAATRAGQAIGRAVLRYRL